MKNRNIDEVRNSNPDLFGTILIGIKICGMILLAAEARPSSYSGTPTKENVIKLEWVTDSIFVARSGYTKHLTNVIKKVRQMYKDTPPSSVEDVVMLFVEETNNELDTIKDDDRGKEFFTMNDIKLRLEQAASGYDHAELAAIVKEFLNDSCVNHIFSKGRATIVTIDDRRFHIYESAYPILYVDPARGYKHQEQFLHSIGECQCDHYYHPIAQVKHLIHIITSSASKCVVFTDSCAKSSALKSILTSTLSDYIVYEFDRKKSRCRLMQVMGRIFLGMEVQYYDRPMQGMRRILNIMRVCKRTWLWRS